MKIGSFMKKWMFRSLSSVRIADSGDDWFGEIKLIYTSENAMPLVVT